MNVETKLLLRDGRNFVEAEPNGLRYKLEAVGEAVNPLDLVHFGSNSLEVSRSHESGVEDTLRKAFYKEAIERGRKAQADYVFVEEDRIDSLSKECYLSGILSMYIKRK